MLTLKNSTLDLSKSENIKHDIVTSWVKMATLENYNQVDNVVEYQEPTNK